MRARQAQQAQLGDVERAERDRLSRLARARAEGVQQRPVGRVKEGEQAEDPADRPVQRRRVLDQLRENQTADRGQRQPRDVTGRIRGAVIGFLMVAAFVGLAIFAWVETRLQAASRSSAASVLQAAGFAGGGFLIFLITYRVLTPGTGVRLRDHVPGAVTFTIAWLALTAVGGLVFTQLIENSTALYGAIGGIFGLLAFLYAANWSLLSMRATRSGSR